MITCQRPFTPRGALAIRAPGSAPACACPVPTAKVAGASIATTDADDPLPNSLRIASPTHGVGQRGMPHRLRAALQEASS